MLQSYAAVIAGGALGVAARFFVYEWFSEKYGDATFPIATFTVNVVGCFIIGVVAGLTGPDGYMAAPGWVRNFVMVGILGGFTTFSSFTLQSVTLMNTGQMGVAFLHIALTLVLCLLGTWGGLALTGLIPQR